MLDIIILGNNPYNTVPMFSGLFFPQILGESNKLGNFTVR
jgi:hypothetical protein